jgi:2,3-bisphosphoglycerate-dependent phosphoglycerate mutase
MVYSTPLLDTSPASHNSTSQVLWLVRHGESTWNARGLAQGHDDQARLTSRGARQARAIAVQLRDRPIRALYASDLRRALQTAAPLAGALGLTVVRDARLRERCLGAAEGTAAASISPAVSGIRDGRVVNPDACPDGGESLRDFYRRVARFISDLADAGRAWDAGRPADADRAGELGEAREVAIVAHGGTLRMLTACREGVPVEEMTWGPLANATVLRSPAFHRVRKTAERKTDE